MRARRLVIGTRRSPARSLYCGAAGAGARVAAGTAVAGPAAVAPPAVWLMMSPLVTRPSLPVPGIWVRSWPPSAAILRAAGPAIAAAFAEVVPAAIIGAGAPALGAGAEGAAAATVP